MTCLATFSTCFESSGMALPKLTLAIHSRIVITFRLFLIFKIVRMNTIVFSVFLNVSLRKIFRSRFISLRFQGFSYHIFLAIKPQNLLSIDQSPRVCKQGLGLTAWALARLDLLLAWRGSPWPAWERIQAWLSIHLFARSLVQVNLARMSFNLLFLKSEVN